MIVRPDTTTAAESAVGTSNASEPKGPDPMTDTDELERLIERLEETERKPWGRPGGGDYNDVPVHAIGPEAAKAILALLSANREMREALEPFALAADNMDGDEPDGLFVYDSPESTMISYGDLRRARSALTTQRGDGE